MLAGSTHEAVAATLHYAARETVYAGGADDPAIYLVLESAAQEQKTGQPAKRVATGDSFCEYGALDGRPQNSTVTAAEALFKKTVPPRVNPARSNRIVVKIFDNQRPRELFDQFLHAPHPQYDVAQPRRVVVPDFAGVELHPVTVAPHDLVVFVGGEP